MELVKLSLLSVLVFVVAVDCRQLSKVEKLDNVLSETSELLDQLKREGSYFNNYKYASCLKKYGKIINK